MRDVGEKLVLGLSGLLGLLDPDFEVAVLLDEPLVQMLQVVDQMSLFGSRGELARDQAEQLAVCMAEGLRVAEIECQAADRLRFEGQWEGDRGAEAELSRGFPPVLELWIVEDVGNVDQLVLEDRTARRPVPDLDPHPAEIA